MDKPTPVDPTGLSPEMRKAKEAAYEIEYGDYIQSLLQKPAVRLTPENQQDLLKEVGNFMRREMR